jgi:hypothetical protein
MKSCMFCGASSDKGSLDENLHLMRQCKNCVADIHMHGQWTGIGWTIIKALIAQYGYEEVVKKWDELG